MEHIVERGNGTVYIVSSIDDDCPYDPPYQYQHDLLSPVLLRPVGSAVQIGVGYGAIACALSKLGWSVTAVDIDLTLWNQASALTSSYPVTTLESDVLELPTDTKYDIAVCDFCGGFESQRDLYGDAVFKKLRGLLSDRGVLSFNIGIWPDKAGEAIIAASRWFDTVHVIPNTQVMVCSQARIDWSQLNAEPDWLCASRSVYG